MEGFEFDTPPPYTAADETDDFCNSIITRFSSSTEDHHHLLCAIIGAMSQELKDHTLPLTPVAYFGATCSSLDRLSAEAEPPSHVVEALLTILSTVITHISAAIGNNCTENVAAMYWVRPASILPAGMNMKPIWLPEYSNYSVLSNTTLLGFLTETYWENKCEWI